jgi:hypothetical protein
VAPKKRPDVVPPDSQLTALVKRSKDEVEEVTQKESSSSSQERRPTKEKTYATAAKFVDFAELFKSPKASEVVATHAGELSERQSRSWAQSLWNSLLWRLWCVPATGASTTT